VVGINTAIIAQGGASLGIGFAVPVNLAAPVIAQLAEFGETRRGWLGVGIDDVSQEVADKLGRKNTNGAIVVDVTKTGPADGVLKNGDIILEFNGRSIGKMRDLPRFVAMAAVGSKATVKILRDGSERTLDITLCRLEVGEQMIAAAQPSSTPPQSDDDLPAGPAPGLKDMLGVDIAPVDESARKTYALGHDAKGVVITAVDKGSEAEKRGLAAGLVISEVNQQKVETVAEVNQKVGEAKEAGRPLVVFKVTPPSGPSRFVAVSLN
jgi:serine protease Do